MCAAVVWWIVGAGAAGPSGLSDDEKEMEDWMRKLILSFYVSLDGKSADGDNGIRDVMESIDEQGAR